MRYIHHLTFFSWRTALLVGLAFRLLCWCLQVKPEGDDGNRYYAESQNLVDYGIFSSETGNPPPPTAHDMPLWPGTMALFLKATGSRTSTVRLAGLLNLALYAGAGLLLAALLKRQPFELNERGRALALWAFVGLPDTWAYSLFHMPDTMALFFLTLALYLFARSCYGRGAWLLASAMAFAAAIYAKPICLPLAIAFALASLIVSPHHWLKRLVLTASFVGLVLLALSPWVLRNKRAFGTAGLTTISGTNLYSCNTAWMINSWPKAKRQVALAERATFEESIQSLDLMAQSKAKGKFAREELKRYWKEYLLFTLKSHPRLYFGTGTLAFLRYFGLEGACTALEEKTGHGSFRAPATQSDRILAYTLQAFAFGLLGLLGGCILMGVGRGLCAAIVSLRPAACWLTPRVVAWSFAFGGILVCALVIGPVVATRYRFIMLPFFAIFAGFAASTRRLAQPQA
ncbi:MAG: hypothetical protein ACI4W7_02055 [Candidatus Spyradenecus sp.]